MDSILKPKTFAPYETEDQFLLTIRKQEQKKALEILGINDPFIDLRAENYLFKTQNIFHQKGIEEFWTDNIQGEIVEIVNSKVILRCSPIYFIKINIEVLKLLINGQKQANADKTEKVQPERSIENLVTTPNSFNYIEYFYSKDSICGIRDRVKVTTIDGQTVIGILTVIGPDSIGVKVEAGKGIGEITYIPSARIADTNLVEKDESKYGKKMSALSLEV